MTGLTLSPVITEAGFQAVFNQTNTGVNADITHIAMGDAAYTPMGSSTALNSERIRVPVASGERLSGTQIHVEALVDKDTEFWIKELGFILADGTLLAAWSHPSQVLAYKSATTPLHLSLDVVLAALPADSVNVIGTGSINLFIALELARISNGTIKMATAQVRTMHRQIKLNDRLLAIGA